MNHRSPNIRHLRAIQHVARNKSISAAAVDIHLSQPAVTQAVGKIEEALNLPLFQRQPDGMYLTEAGELFCPRVERAMGFIEEASREVCRQSPSAHTPSASQIVQLLTTTQLRALVAVCEDRNFSLAGRTLGISQSSVHRAARELEAVLEMPLFDKTSGGISPTKPALALAKASKLAFAEIRQGFDEVLSLEDREVGRIAVGAMPLARTAILPRSINGFSRQHADIGINVVDGPYADLLYHLRQGDIDILIGALRRPLPSEDIEQRELYCPPLAILARAGHPLQGEKPITLEQLAHSPWVVPRRGTPTRDEFERLFSVPGVAPPSQIVESSSQVLVRELLLGSDRLALTSSDQFLREEQLGLLRPLDLDLPHTRRPIGVTLRRSWHPTRLQQKFVDMLCQEAILPPYSKIE